MRRAAALLLVLVAACGGAGASVPQDAPLPSDDGAAARAAVLARPTDRSSTTLAVPDIVGLRPTAAAATVEAAGLTLRLVPHDRTQAVTAQFPAAGAPVPPSGSVEAWLGTPPTEEPTASPTSASSSPAPSPQPSTETTAQPAPTTPSPSVTAGRRYLLPPHTPGRLRINPRYLPAVPAGTELTGLASWYGPGFHGLTTACGGVYDQNGPTLASRELRCGTVVRITGPSGLTVEATVTDWGPAEWAGRRFDLSAAVFNAIAPLGVGVIPVRVVTVNQPR